MQNKTYTYEEAMKASAEYFNETQTDDKLVASTFINKYALRDRDGNLLEKTPSDLHNRLAAEFARIEKAKFKNPMTQEEIFCYFDHFQKIIPQGGPMTGIGNNQQYISLANCFVISSPKDSYSSIMTADQQLVQISKRRGGVGMDLSNLRPTGTSVNNAARTSTGAVSFMKRFSNSIREVAQNGRRGALLLSISIHHPESVILLADGVKPEPIIIPADPENNMPEIHTTTEFYNPSIPDFATIKYNKKEITGANVSIRLTDEFLNAVAKGTKFEQRWPVDSPNPIYKKMVDARKVWKKIIHAAWQMGEPGLLFWNRIISESPADCYSSLGFSTQCTNPCGELPLSPGDSCRLIALNLLTYVKDPYTPKSAFDYEGFSKDVAIAQRLGDDLIDLEIESIKRIISKIENDPEDEETKAVELNLWKKILETCSKGRRTGTGTTALGDTFAALGLKYGSEASIKEADKIYRTLKLACYRSSVEMAKELGAFPVWDPSLEKNNPFLLRIKDEDPQLYMDMQKYGRRNISILTLAPGGTISMMSQTTSGVEPLFNMKYQRRKKINPNDKGVRVDIVDGTGDSWQFFDVNHKQIEEWSKVTGEKDIEKSPWFGSCITEIHWKNRVQLQAKIGLHIDHSISSTVNLPENTSETKVAEIYEEAWKSGCKGITIYRENCRSGVLVNKPSEADCGKCDSATEDLRKAIESRPATIMTSSSPRRPKVLKCDIYRTKVGKEEWLFFVGLWENGLPFEIFGGSPKGFKIPKKFTTGWIEKDGVKDGRTTYDLILGDLENEDEKLVFENIAKRFEKYDKGTFTRCISLILRHGIPIKHLNEQLIKDPEGDLFSFSNAIARVLKKYISEGEKSGLRCSNCGSENVIYRNGCPSCKNCAWSACS